VATGGWSWRDDGGEETAADSSTMTLRRWAVVAGGSTTVDEEDAAQIRPAAARWRQRRCEAAVHANELTSWICYSPEWVRSYSELDIQYVRECVEVHVHECTHSHCDRCTYVWRSYKSSNAGHHNSFDLSTRYALFHLERRYVDHKKQYIPVLHIYYTDSKTYYSLWQNAVYTYWKGVYTPFQTSGVNFTL
jgi:hypothetical protein